MTNTYYVAINTVTGKEITKSVSKSKVLDFIQKQMHPTAAKILIEQTVDKDMHECIKVCVDEKTNDTPFWDKAYHIYHIEETEKLEITRTALTCSYILDYYTIGRSNIYLEHRFFNFNNKHINELDYYNKLKINYSLLEMLNDLGIDARVNKNYTVWVSEPINIVNGELIKETSKWIKVKKYLNL